MFLLRFIKWLEWLISQKNCHFVLLNILLEKAESFTRNTSFHSFSLHLINRFYINPGNYFYNKKVMKNSTEFFNNFTQLQNTSSVNTSKKALVFIFKGFATRALQAYLMACALRHLGYKVSIVICGGNIEQCGYGQEETKLRTPPYACNTCRNLTKLISSQGFEIINLNNFITSDENQKVVLFDKLSIEEKKNYKIYNIKVFETIKPFLIRFYSGQYWKIEAFEEDVLKYHKSAIRYSLRFKNLLDHINPSCITIFNGLFFPDCLFFNIARERNIPVLLHEVGNKKDTNFISINDPACNYRIDKLWEKTKNDIDEQKISIAKKYLDNRMIDAEDPTGRKRKISDDDNNKYEKLKEKPYIIYFASVAHDTASMEKDDVFGGFHESLIYIAKLAIENNFSLIVRSHPDEVQGINPSKYRVTEFMKDNNLLNEKNVLCLDSKQIWNPYKLAEYSKAIIVYNGNLGIELGSLGYNVYNIANSHYCNKGFTAEVNNKNDIEKIFISPIKHISESSKNEALKYLYYCNFDANISASNFLEEYAPFEYKYNETKDIKEQQKEFISLVNRIDFLLNNA